MNSSHTSLYRFVRRLIGVALGFYFRRIERFHVERVPESGPLLFTSNHPNSITDSYIIGASVPHKVNFVATVKLFRYKPLKWFLSHCGVIPINRAKDDPRAMRTVAETFEACYRVLERGECVGIFPEGISNDDSRMGEVKSGAARMALEVEQRNGGKLGLRIVPVGLTYSAKELYRSDALANFGEPIRVAEFLEGYAERRKECITKLTGEIERRIQSLILHIPELEHTRVVEGVKRLYLDRLRPGDRIAPEALAPRAGELDRAQRIAAAVEHVYRQQPERAAAFAVRLDQYERRMKRLNLSDEALVSGPGRKNLVSQSLWWAGIAILGAPIALYGWVHRLIPYAIVKWAVRKFTEPERRKAQTSATVIEAGIPAFGVFYGIYVLIVHRLFGWPVSLWYALSLPVTGLLAHYYLRELSTLAAGARNTIVLLRAPVAARRLLAQRAELIQEIETVHAEIKQPPATKV